MKLTSSEFHLPIVLDCIQTDKINRLRKHSNYCNIYTVLNLHLGLWGQPWGWWGPRLKGVWQPYSRPLKIFPKIYIMQSAYWLHSTGKKKKKTPQKNPNLKWPFLKCLLNDLTFGSTQSKITDCNNSNRTVLLPKARQLLSVVQHSR